MGLFSSSKKKKKKKKQQAAQAAQAEQTRLNQEREAYFADLIEQEKSAKADLAILEEEFAKESSLLVSSEELKDLVSRARTALSQALGHLRSLQSSNDSSRVQIELKKQEKIAREKLLQTEQENAKRQMELQKMSIDLMKQGIVSGVNNLPSIQIPGMNNVISQRDSDL